MFTSGDLYHLMLDEACRAWNGPGPARSGKQPRDSPLLGANEMSKRDSHLVMSTLRDSVVQVPSTPVVPSFKTRHEFLGHSGNTRADGEPDARSAESGSRL